MMTVKRKTIKIERCRHLGIWCSRRGVTFIGDVELRQHLGYEIPAGVGELWVTLSSARVNGALKCTVVKHANYVRVCRKHIRNGLARVANEIAVGFECWMWVEYLEEEQVAA